VTVTINGQATTATAAADGRWQVLVGPFAAGGPYTLSVTGPQSASFTNVMMGDVFLCSGQSNMEFTVSGVFNASAEIADSANYPNIRCFTVPKISALTPQDNLSSGTWKVANTSNTGGFTATGYFMARELYKKLGIPLGIVSSAWGGTQIQSWVKMATAASIADFTQTIFDQSVIPPNADTISGHYNGLISPLAPFRFKAAVWYQGEFNAGRGQQYSRLLPGLMSDWRALFAQPNLQFIVVQLPNNDAAQTQPVETGGWAEIREAQVKAVVADSGRSRIVNTIDIGGGILHPLNKQDVGLRASWAALNLIYGQNVVNQGPILTSATISGSSIICSFSNVGAGLMVGSKDYSTPLSPTQQLSGTAVDGFSIAGADHVFHFADATITSASTVSVSSSTVPSPLYVRYGWANNPHCNLYNKITDAGGAVINGLPAGSFRNDPVYRLSVNAAGGGRDSYTIPVAGSVTASVPSGHAFHHWGGDTAALASTTASPTTATLSNLYTSIRAYFQITGAPVVTVTAQGGQNVIQWSSLGAIDHYDVMRATAAAGPYTTIASNLGVLTATDQGILDGTIYYYKVAGHNEVGQGPGSTAVSVVGIGASASSQNPPNETAEKLFDWNTATKWFAPSVSAAWVRFNYGPGAAQTVVGYVLTSANDTPTRDPKNWQFQGSNDGSSWTTLDTRTGETFSARFQAKGYTFSNATAYQYYRLNVTLNSGATAVGVQMSELSLATGPVAGQPLSRTGWNYDALVTQSGSLLTNVADGSLSTRWTPGTSQTPGQWFQVDFGSAKVFHQLVLDAGTSTNDYPRGYQVTVSNDGVNWSSPVASGVGTSTVTTITFAAQAARYVRVTQTGSNSGYWSISELNVY